MLSKLFNLPWPPGFFFPECPCCADEDTPWCGFGSLKLFLQSGQFTSTVITSISYSDSLGISWDSVGENTPFGDFPGSRLVLSSGQFTSTILDSQSVSAINNQQHGISWDGTNTPWTGVEFVKLYLQSGQFTSTLKTSQSLASELVASSGINTNKRTTG